MNDAFILRGAKVMLLVLIGCAMNYTLAGRAGGNSAHEKTINWMTISSAHDSFLECPSEENARTFLDALPIDVPEAYDPREGEAFFRYFVDPRNYPIFRSEIWAGNANATRAAFRIMNLSSGATGQLIRETLGQLVRINPHLFIRIYDEYKSCSFIRRYGPPLASISQAYVDRISARKYELKMRIMALENVADEKYQLVKKECIDYLKVRIREIPE